MKPKIQAAVLCCIIALVLQRGASAQVALTDVRLFAAQSDGTHLGPYWNTVGSDFGYNVYLFIGPNTSPTFITSGNTNTTLVPNYHLAPGTYTLGFAGDSAPGPYVNLQLFFNGDSLNSGINVLIPDDGSTNFVGTNSCTVNGLTITLTKLQTFVPHLDLTSPYETVPNGSPDTAGQFELAVGASAPAPLGMNVEIAAIRLRWYAEPNKAYQVQYRSTLTTNYWTDLGDPIPGDGSLKSLTEEVSQPQRFYRVTTLP